MSIRLTDFSILLNYSPIPALYDCLINSDIFADKYQDDLSSADWLTDCRTQIDAGHIYKIATYISTSKQYYELITR